MLTKDNLNETLADAVMDRPREFFIGDKRFCLWSPTLGMSLMLERHIAELGINNQILSDDAAMEALRLSFFKTEKVCTILSILSFRKFSDLSNSRKIKERSKFFQSNLDNKELSQLLLWALREPKAETFISLSPIGKQREKQALISQIKKSNNTLTFGGNTIYGSLIMPAMTTLNLDYFKVVWGISLVNLKMLLADCINTVYLSEEEAKKICIIPENTETIGMTDEDFNLLKKEFCD